MSAALEFRFDQEWTPEILGSYLKQLATESSNDVDWRRFEIVDGALVVSPSATRPHEMAIARLIVVLTAAAPAGVAVIGSAAVGIGRSYRITDVTVLSESKINAPEAFLTGSDVLLAVEIEPPSSITTDRITKPAQYAGAGIAHCWRLETDPLRLIAYRLDDDAYVEVGAWGASEVARLTEPMAVEIDVAALVP